MEVLLIIVGVFLIVILLQKSKLKNDLNEKKKELIKKDKEFDSYKAESEKYKRDTEYLRKYEVIRDIEVELERISKQIQKNQEVARKEVEELKEKAEIEAASVKKDARITAKEVKEKAEAVLEQAHSLAKKIEDEANKKAEETAGEAWEAKQYADQYSQTVKAMKNIIKGYGDEYLIPNRSLLDDLAEEYTHKEAGQELTQIRALIKSMIKNREVGDCDYVETHRKETAIEFVIDAFNGKVDTIMSKVKHDNFGKLKQELKDAYRIVNHNGKPFRNARINERYFDVVMEQLKLAVTVQELKKRDQEEQKAIREAMREEEKVRREVERALKAAEKEEKLLAKAMKAAEAKLSQAAADDRAKLEEELALIKQKLSDAEERGQRALSMAQQTKRGHVYIISNIGSFGEEVVKIGLTRRLEPMDRVKELGDASVPFSFDVHAMIHSEDAPKLEKELHDVFENNRVNKVNYRKEFFTVPITTIKEKIDNLNLETLWTMKAEAKEYRESVELKRREQKMVGVN
ncbi:DUF4041 domain-containing protein [Marinifilum sp. D714]|uniref:DUF4041 domain-containing protein n=1 Tax=Marinifilum sp. D714 TaxID=2937523 RepID=UPI0027C98ABF|nr:DUF4041 domain-containing protein [Marinifilum sp. D714]MDQ2178047.1 DUF4041 domain-containing protein [Marinifilum sp. D714]